MTTLFKPKLYFITVILLILWIYTASCGDIEHEHHHEHHHDMFETHEPHEHHHEHEHNEHHHHHNHDTISDTDKNDEIHEPAPPHTDKSCTINDDNNILHSWNELFIPSKKRSAFWYSILSTIFIGCVPILCIKCVSTNDIFLKSLLSFASGGLMGDVFLHLIPAALTIYDNHHDHSPHDHHSHSHNSGHVLLGQQILFGFLIFFILEKIFHEFGGHHTHDHGGTHNGPNGSNGGTHKHEHKHEIDDNQEAKKKAVTILSIFADFSHNFTDGLTISASFLYSYKMGIIQSFSILLHEIPHEIGDYAILIENGVNIKTAMFIQFLTAIGCLLGTIIGFVVENNTDIGTKWIIPVTAGGFIYISCVQVLPILAEKKYGIYQSFLHVMMFILGILLMIFVSFVEENAEHFFTL